MNDFDWAIEKNLKVGIRAYLRTSRDGALKPILSRGGIAKVYSTEKEAVTDLLVHLVKYINGNMLRDGEIAGTSLAEAQAFFKSGPRSFVKQKGKTRPIDVSSKRQGRACGKLRLKTSAE